MLELSRGFQGRDSGVTWRVPAYNGSLAMDSSKVQGQRPWSGLGAKPPELASAGVKRKWQILIFLCNSETP